MDKLNVQIPHTSKLQAMKEYHMNMRENFMLSNTIAGKKQANEVQKLCSYVIQEISRIEKMKG